MTAEETICPATMGWGRVVVARVFVGSDELWVSEVNPITEEAVVEDSPLMAEGTREDYCLGRGREGERRT